MADDLAVSGTASPDFLRISMTLDSSSSTVFVTPVTTSMGVPFLPMKNRDGRGTSLSGKHGIRL